MTCQEQFYLERFPFRCDSPNYFSSEIQTLALRLRGAVAEWSKVLHLRQKMNENLKMPGSHPGQTILKNWQQKMSRKVYFVALSLDDCSATKL